MPVYSRTVDRFMDDGDKFYLTNIYEAIADGRLVDFEFYTNKETQAEVPALIFELPDGQHRKLLIYKDDQEDDPGWLEIAD